VTDAHVVCTLTDLGKFYRVAIDLVNEMSGVLNEIDLKRLPHYTVLRTWFARISTKTWPVFFDASVEECTGHTAIDSTDFDRDQSGRHYANHTNYCVRTLKITALVDLEML